MRNPIRVAPDSTTHINREGIILQDLVPDFKGTGLYCLEKTTILVVPQNQVPVIWRRDWKDEDMFVVSVWGCNFQDTILAYSDIPVRLDL